MSGALVYRASINRPSPITLSGTLSASGATSTVTGTSRTVTVPSGNSGKLQFRNVITVSGSFAENPNGAGFAAITENLVITLADGNSLQCRITSALSGDLNYADLYDYDTGTLIETILVQRT